MSRAFAALASGGTATPRRPEGLRPQRSNEAHHHPKTGAANTRRIHSVCRDARFGAPPSEPWLVRPAIGVRLSPRSLRAGPALLGARFRASPGIRVSRSGRSRRIQRRAAAEAQKNPPERRLGRVRRNGFSISYQKRSPPGVARPHINGPWPVTLAAIRSHRDSIAQLASRRRDHSRTRRSVVGLFLIVNRQSTKTQSCRDGEFGCGGEDTARSLIRRFKGEGGAIARPTRLRATVILANARIQDTTRPSRLAATRRSRSVPIRRPRVVALWIPALASLSRG